MKFYSGICFDESGISTSIRAMHLQTELMSNISKNITGFDKVGYQREESVISSFSEYIGPHALSVVKDESVGRLYNSGNSLDFALAKPGYFQCQTKNGIKLNRDGRFKLDKNGNLLTLDDNKVLSKDGTAIKFNKIPQSLSDIKVGVNGDITAFDRETNKTTKIASFSVVSSNGSLSEDPDVRQGFVETSNVKMHEEVFNLVPVRRNFDANRQMIVTQNDELTKAIQELGRA
ncbi:MAG: flagellar basal body rod C-terminal domain-containing protein [Candidatus Gastranaerophilaceae bacterium]|jgi:flagellar basal body rod protein FlgG